MFSKPWITARPFLNIDLNQAQTIYIDKLPQMLNENTMRLYTSYHQAVTATGCLSSSDPNLRNIPTKKKAGAFGKFYRTKGHTFLAADYSQIERGSRRIYPRRRFAQCSMVKTSMKPTAAEIFGILDEVDSEQRRNAKAINFI